MSDYKKCPKNDSHHVTVVAAHDAVSRHCDDCNVYLPVSEELLEVAWNAPSLHLQEAKAAQKETKR